MGKWPALRVSIWMFDHHTLGGLTWQSVVVGPVAVGGKPWPGYAKRYGGVLATVRVSASRGRRIFAVSAVAGRQPELAAAAGDSHGKTVKADPSCPPD